MSEPSDLVEIDSMAHGGSGVGRSAGKVVFVDGAIPGDRVEAATTDDHHRFRRAMVRRVDRPSSERIVPPCPYFDRCGGCDWQMGTLEAQRRWKADIVRDQLVHVGRFPAPSVGETRAGGGGFGYRNRVDLRVSRGRPALYEAGSHRPVEIDHCPQVLAPISEVIGQLDPDESVDRITVRASERTGEMAVMERRAGRWTGGVIHEEVAGRRFRVTDRAFFQVNTDGAEVLVALVADILDVGSRDVLVDGYAGGGLFAATVGAEAGSVIAVESDPVAGTDLAVNAPHARSVRRRFHLSADAVGQADAIVVDPPRSGLGADGVPVVVGSDAGRLAYVSCDPASFARDARLLVDAGFTLGPVTPVDMFPQTHHVELVAALER